MSDLFTPVKQDKSTWNQWAEWSRNGLEPRIKANRFDDTRGNRFYWWQDDDRIVIGAGITSWLKKVQPESTFLTDWKVKYGKDNGTVLNLTADYGTQLHAMFAFILLRGEYPPAEMFEVARSYLLKLKQWESGIPYDQPEKDVAAFIQWTRDYEVKPLMVEAILPCHTQRGDWYCMTADLPCELTLTEKVEVQDGELKSGPNKGMPKMVKVEKKRTITACVDFKSNPFGKDSKSFFDSHLYQLLATKKAMQQNFGIEVDELYNWSPDNWRNEPKYTFHKWNVTDKDKQIFAKLEEMAGIMGAFTPSGNIRVFNEKWSAENPDATLFRSYGYEEYVREVLLKGGAQ